MFPQSTTHAITLTILIFAVSHYSRASGVFELELLDLQQLGDSPKPQRTASAANVAQQDPLRVNICLKEAFTSQLDGPCPFGEASITLGRNSIQRLQAISVIDSDESSSSELKDSNAQQGEPDQRTHDTSRTPNETQIRSPGADHQIQGSQLTNLVRILFTFRWMKSFTIILSAEEVQLVDAPIRSPPVATSGGNLSQADQQNTSLIHRHFADRHVLTENEVLPNLELNPHKIWATRFSRTLKSSLSYRFRVYCSLNYFGDGCTTFCRPRDDQFGHFNCSSSGQKVCLEGWTGAECDRAKCRAGCNLQHGSCDKPDTCQCRSGWTGQRCDECITYPGCQNGYCLSSWQCICHRNWGGVLCDQDLNYCGTHAPCRNNGTCLNVAPGKYKCQCQSGFTGVDCELAAAPANQLGAGCALNPCLNNGTCFGFTGQLVDSASSAELVASIEGAPAINPLLVDRLYRCQCPVGWTGDYCQWPEASSPPIVGVVSTAPNETSKIDVTSSTGQPEARELVEQLIASTALTTVDYPPSVGDVNMRQLISGVVIASVVGVFLAVTLLAWTCWLMVKRSGFSFIQMNIIRGGDGNSGQHIVTATLRRMGDKIRDSFRRTSRIIPESKLNIDNVLGSAKPPPSYEESSHYHALNRIATEYPPIHIASSKSSSLSAVATSDSLSPSTITNGLVKKGALAQKLATIQTSKDPIKRQQGFGSQEHVSTIEIHCPRHSMQATNHNRTLDPEAIYPDMEYYVDPTDLARIDHYKRSGLRIT